MSVPPNMPTRSEDVDEALLRSVAYGALAMGFLSPSDENNAHVLSADGARHLSAVLGELGVVAHYEPPSVRLADLEARHVSLFSHAVRGRVPLYETEYGKLDKLQQPRALSDISGFMAAFGLEVAPGANERADHVRVECELMSFFARKEAYALEHGDDEMLRETRKAARLFLRDHLGRFGPALGSRLQREDAGGVYAALGGVLGPLVSWDCARVGVEPGPEAMGVRLRVIEDESPMSCGSGAEDLL